MGIAVKDHIFTDELAQKTQKLALEKASELQRMVDDGKFDGGERTMNIEQETFVVNCASGKPVNVEQLMLSSPLGIRPDTAVYIMEYDGNEVTPVTRNGILELLHSFQEKTRAIQQEVTRATNGQGLLVSIGTQPLVGNEFADFIVSDPSRRTRYIALEEATFERENDRKKMVIKNDITGERLVSRASNLSAMARCAATQLHLAFPTAKETLEAYNISIAIAGLIIAMFSNSPYAMGIDTGLASSRLEMLEQAEQKRGGLAKPARSIEQHFRQTLERCLPPFIEVYDPAKALDLVYGAMHISTRIRLDERSGSSRIELRMIDSLSPHQAIQVLMLTIGLIEGLRGKKLPTYAESLENYKQGRKGLRSTMQWLGEPIDTRNLSLRLIDIAKHELRRLGLEKMGADFLNPLEENVSLGITRADLIRQEVQSLEKDGLSREAALTSVLAKLNQLMLKGN